MKKATKFFAVILAVVLAAGMLCGCGGEKTVKEKGKYTYWAVLPAATAQTVKSFEELLMYQEMEKRTGIEVDFIHPSSGSTGTEAFQILLTSTDMPDMVEYNWGSYPGGVDKAVENKVIIAINDYMEECAPNYYSYMEGEKSKEYPLYRVQSVTQNGNYYGFKNLNIGTYRGFAGLIVRKDLLDKWGLDVPVTIDDWTEVFKTAKENGVAKPLTGDNVLFSIYGAEIFNGAWNVGKDFHLEGDKVVFAIDTPEYKQYIKQMADWFKAGYIDRDYVTNEANVVQGNMTNGSSIAVYGFVGGTIGKLLPAMAEKDPNYDLIACPYPVLNEGDTPWFQELQAESRQPAIAISYQCGKEDEERYKEAIKWCDYLYSDEGIILKSFGVEGVTYKETTGEDGNKKYEYLITSPEEQEKIGAHSVEAVLYHYFIPANAPGFNQHPDYLEGFYPYQQQKDAIKTWNKYIDEAKKHHIPSLTYTNEEATRMAEINANYREKLDAAISRIICNEVGMDTYDAAVKEAKEGGYDELTKIHQAAYDRYMANLK